MRARSERFDVVSTGTRYLHRRPGTWGTRAVNWVVLEDRDTDRTLSLVSAHPSPEGPSSRGLLPVYVSGLSTLVRELAAAAPPETTQAPVLAENFERELNASLHALFGR